jgi:hypothetical protein
VVAAGTTDDHRLRGGGTEVAGLGSGSISHHQKGPIPKKHLVPLRDLESKCLFALLGILFPLGVFQGRKFFGTEQQFRRQFGTAIAAGL